MAKVKFSALVSEMRNKLNGSVFARNRGGNYLRTKVTPTNPKSAAQVLVRSRLTQFSQAWRGLTQAQRDAWNSVVSQFATTDIFGDIVNPSGNTLYTKINSNITNAGGVALVLPPNPTGVTALTEVSVQAQVTGNGFGVAFAPDEVPANTAMIIEATPCLSAGISNANSQFRQIAVVPATEESPYDAGADYIAKFGTLTAGKKVFVRAKFVNLLTGEVSQALSNYTIVTA